MTSPWRKLATIGRSMVTAFGDDELMTRAAALAFYTALSLAPLLLFLVWAISIVEPAWLERFMGMLAGIMGSRAALTLKDIVVAARRHTYAGQAATVVGVVVTVFSASAVFAQLQGTLNRVWHVKPKPGAALGAWLRARAHALSLMMGVGFLLVISFVVSSFVESFVTGTSPLWKGVEVLLGALTLFAAFCAMYKVLPDAAVDLSDVVLGALITSLLFVLGRYAINFYVARANVGGAYGSAAGFIILLTWAYYSALVVLIGASLTRAVADALGKPIRPSEHAVEITPAPVEQPESSRDKRSRRSG